MNIKKLLKSIFGKKEYIEPISDGFIYKANRNSFSGNSLDQSNVLIVTNYSTEADELNNIKKLLKTEGCYFRIYNLTDKNLQTEDIIECGNELIGPFTHIINYAYFSKRDIFSETCPFQLDVTKTYQLIQQEVSYLCSHVQYGTLCTCVLVDDINDTHLVSEASAVSSLIKGLGLVLSNHNIIENGIIADINVKLDDIIPVSLYLSSKYGQILAGEVININYKY